MAASSESRPDSTWSVEQRQTYERESLREVREQLMRVTANPIEQHDLLDVRLDDAYPDTTIVVTLWDGRVDKELRRSYSLWQDPTFVTSSGIREPPNQVGLLITTWALGG
jgi:hypothetical protein